MCRTPPSFRPEPLGGWGTVCVLLSGIIVQIRILQSGWEPDLKLYSQAEKFLVEQGARPDDIAIVRNPAGYYIVTGRRTIVMPPGGPDTILALGARYHASYFILEPSGVIENYQELYDQYDVNVGLKYLGEVDHARIYALHPSE